jgi:hypothetical protein
MDLLKDFKIAVTVSTVVVIVIFGRAWISEHDARLRAEEQNKAQAAMQKQAQDQISALSKQVADRDATYQTALATLDKKFSQAATPDQTAQLAAALMGLRAPITVVSPAPSAANPNPTPVAEVPQSDFPQAKTYIQECEQCKLDRDKLTKDAADRATEAALAQKQIEAVKAERDTWEKAAKGGSVLQRIRKGAKWFAWGAVAGAVALCGSGHCR